MINLIRLTILNPIHLKLIYCVLSYHPLDR
jgi:hypothetical protein